MQPNQLSCLALGVCFLWGHLRFITSKGARWFYWDIQRTRSTEPFQPVQLCKCICMSWALWGWTCRERNAACVMSSDTDWTVSWTQKEQRERRVSCNAEPLHATLFNWLSGQTSSHNSGWDSNLPLPAGDGRGLSSCLWCIKLTFTETRVRTDAPGLPQLQIVKTCQSVGARGLFYFGVFFFNLCGCASMFPSVCCPEASLTGHKEEKTSACVKKRPCQDKAIWFCHKSHGEEG